MTSPTQRKFEVAIVTSFGRNKNPVDEIKKKTKRRPKITSAIALRLLNKYFQTIKTIRYQLKCLNRFVFTYTSMCTSPLAEASGI